LSIGAQHENERNRGGDQPNKADHFDSKRKIKRKKVKGKKKKSEKSLSQSWHMRALIRLQVAAQ
jgi:hypothetical protein